MSTLFAPAATCIKFTVLGTPRPPGSMKAFINKFTGKAQVKSQIKGLASWRQDIAAQAMKAASETPSPVFLPIFVAHVPVEVTLNFYFTKPKSSKRIAMTTRPDGDKLLRSFCDSITGILVHDDAQIIEFHVRKHYGGPDRLEIEIQEADVGAIAVVVSESDDVGLGSEVEGIDRRKWLRDGPAGVGLIGPDARHAGEARGRIDLVVRVDCDDDDTSESFFLELIGDEVGEEEVVLGERPGVAGRKGHFVHR
jgi:crossover junction endodeoxyribonuclease RusA